MNSADISIWGMTLSEMNSLSRIGLVSTAVRNNIVTVMAGEVGGNMSLVFAGGIKQCWPDFSSSTEGILKVDAKTGLLAQMQSIAPKSYSGATDVPTVMAQLAQQMGFTFQNNGVTGTVRDPYLPGTARAQALALADMAGIYVIFDDDGGTMAIVPNNGTRTGDAPVISPLEDMNGYPSYVGPGKVQLVCEYNNQIKFMGKVTVQDSIISGANQAWQVTGIAHDLSTRPDGPWFTTILGRNTFL